MKNVCQSVRGTEALNLANSIDVCSPYTHPMMSLTTTNIQEDTNHLQGNILRLLVYLDGVRITRITTLYPAFGSAAIFPIMQGSLSANASFIFVVGMIGRLFQKIFLKI